MTAINYANPVLQFIYNATMVLGVMPQLCRNAKGELEAPQPVREAVVEIPAPTPAVQVEPTPVQTTQPTIVRESVSVSLPAQTPSTPHMALDDRGNMLGIQNRVDILAAGADEALYARLTGIRRTQPFEKPVDDAQVFANWDHWNGGLNAIEKSLVSNGLASAYVPELPNTRI
jgi:hypothetical protein